MDPHPNAKEENVPERDSAAGQAHRDLAFDYFGTTKPRRRSYFLYGSLRRPAARSDPNKRYSIW